MVKGDPLGRTRIDPRHRRAGSRFHAQVPLARGQVERERATRIDRLICKARPVETMCHRNRVGHRHTRLDELYVIIRDFAASKPAAGGPGIMAKLRDVRIEAPPDFATNLDLYLSGEKRVPEDIH